MARKTSGRLSRRTAIRLGGIAGVGALAGCLGGDDDDDVDTGDDDTADDVDDDVDDDEDTDPTGAGDEFLSEIDGDSLRLVIPFSPGGGFDTYMRGVAPYIERHFESLYDVDIDTTPENVTGGGGVVGYNEVATSDPDGTEIVMMTSTTANSAVTLRPDDIVWGIDDWEYVAQISYNIKTLVGPSDGPSNWDEVVDHVESEGSWRAASDGVGAPGHIGGIILSNELDVQMDPVHYEGVSEAMTGIARGEADWGIINWSSALPWVEDGDVGFAVKFGEEQVSPDADVPLAPEEGVPNWETVAGLTNVTRVFALTPGTDQEIVDIWEDVLLEAMNDEEFIEWAEEEERPLTPGDAEEATSNMALAGEVYEENADLLRDVMD